MPAAVRPQVDALLNEAMNKRTVGCTALNEQSSRSHMVFTLKIDGTNSSTGEGPRQGPGPEEPRPLPSNQARAQGL